MKTLIYKSDVRNIICNEMGGVNDTFGECKYQPPKQTLLTDVQLFVAACELLGVIYLAIYKHLIPLSPQFSTTSCEFFFSFFFFPLIKRK